MTREEAKKRLEVWLICGECPEDKQCYDSYLHSTCEYTDYCDEVSLTDAVKVAISALSENKGDLISRQAVLTLFKERFLELQIVKQLPENKVQEYVQGGVNWCINTVRDIPSAENKGEWIAQDIHNCCTVFKCSKCGYEHNFLHLYGKPTADYPYCPDCGARMKGGE